MDFHIHDFDISLLNFSCAGESNAPVACGVGEYNPNNGSSSDADCQVSYTCSHILGGGGYFNT